MQHSPDETARGQDLQAQGLELRRRELELDRARMAIDFAKFGFRGTLTAALIGMLLLFALALLEAFTTFKLGTMGYVGLAFVILAGAIIFGFLSLWELPKFMVRVMHIGEFGIDPNAKKPSADTNQASKPDQGSGVTG